MPKAILFLPASQKVLGPKPPLENRCGSHWPTPALQTKTLRPAGSANQGIMFLYHAVSQSGDSR